MSAVPEGGFVYLTVFVFVAAKVATYSVSDTLARYAVVVPVPSDDAPVYVVAIVTAHGVTANIFILVATPFPHTGNHIRLSDRYTPLNVESHVVCEMKAVPFIVITVPLTEFMKQF